MRMKLCAPWQSQRRGCTCAHWTRILPSNFATGKLGQNIFCLDWKLDQRAHEACLHLCSLACNPALLASFGNMIWSNALFLHKALACWPPLACNTALLASFGIKFRSIDLLLHRALACWPPLACNPVLLASFGIKF